MWKLIRKIKNVGDGEVDEDERGERWFGDKIIQLAKSGDQWSAEKEKIKWGKTCEK